jgi:hypothetical protein
MFGRPALRGGKKEMRGTGSTDSLPAPSREGVDVFAGDMNSLQRELVGV